MTSPKPDTSVEAVERLALSMFARPSDETAVKAGATLLKLRKELTEAQERQRVGAVMMETENLHVLDYERTSGNQVVLTFNREPTETEAHDIYSTVGGWLSAWFDIYKKPHPQPLRGNDNDPDREIGSCE